MNPLITAPPRWKITIAFAAIYLIWGSTYLAIRFAIETIPPFLMAGTRFLVAGALFYAVTRPKERPALADWAAAACAGVLLLTLGNGGVSLAEKSISSGLVALLVAIVPFWILLLDWMRPNGIRPTWLQIGALFLGLAGVALLTRNHWTAKTNQWSAVALVLAASLAWAAGSLFSRRRSSKHLGRAMPAMQMIAGGLGLLLIALFRGEPSEVRWHQVTWHSFSAWIYLVVAGSGIGFTAYHWLLGVTKPALVATYAFVNPAVALLLGCSLGGETAGSDTLAGGGLVLASVMALSSGGARNWSWTRILLRLGVSRAELRRRIHSHREQQGLFTQTGR
jgi:drug/metabolite transporter (DMT)-like permease